MSDTIPGHLRRSLPALLAVALLALVSAQSPDRYGRAQPRTDRIGVHVKPLDTRHYRIFSELDRATTHAMAAELEACYEDYVRRLGTLVDTTHLASGSADRYEVHLFQSQASYARFTRGDLPNSAGAFYPQLRALCAYLDGQGRAEMKRTLRHEAFHQFASEAIGSDLPQWLNEGLAQVFEHGIRVGNSLEMGELPPGPLREIQAIVAGGETIDFADMLSMSNTRWNQGMASRRRGSVQYAQAWAMTHFLIYARGNDGQPKFRERFNAMLRDLSGGVDGQAAFTRNFGNNLDGFRKHFEAWVLAQQPTEVAQAFDDQTALAEMLVLLHKGGRSFNDAQQFGKFIVSSGFVLTRSRNGVEWSSDSDPRRYFTDPAGRPLAGASLRLETEPSSPIPTLHRRPGDGRIYETAFYSLGGKVWSETTCRHE